MDAEERRGHYRHYISGTLAQDTPVLRHITFIYDPGGADDGQAAVHAVIDAQQPGKFRLIVRSAGLEAWQAVAIGFTLHASAFLGEIWRGSIEAVPRGQVEAAKALSLHYASRMKDIVLPQAIRISLPATIGFLVQLIKGTSLAAIVGSSSNISRITWFRLRMSSQE